MIFPDSFDDWTVYSYQGEDYAQHDGQWYRLWGAVPHGGRMANLVTDPGLIKLLDVAATPQRP